MIIEKKFTEIQVISKEFNLVKDESSPEKKSLAKWILKNSKKYNWLKDVQTKHADEFMILDLMKSTGMSWNELNEETDIVDIQLLYGMEYAEMATQELYLETQKIKNRPSKGLK